jgi:hypothetical protein
VREVQWPTISAGAAARIATSFPGTTERNQGDLTRGPYVRQISEPRIGW